jgi:hypothetical protein
MNTQLIEQALELADTQQLAIFPVGADKRPIIKGWRPTPTRSGACSDCREPQA